MSILLPYEHCSITLTTKHAKGSAIAPAFKSILSADVLECELDTDTLGTFSGEIERKGNAMDCAKQKCEWGMQISNTEFGLASEGSFGPHPQIPLIPCHHEILYFIDKKRAFHLPVSCITDKTNYDMQLIGSMEELITFANKALFPSHALILRPDNKEHRQFIFKGIHTQQMLETAFMESLHRSLEGKVWVETDMRAHMNPSRMLVIKELAEQLATRLLALCPQCESPGWGRVDSLRGLPCSLCGMETQYIKSEVYGCTTCDHKENMPPLHGLLEANPINCEYCNP